MPGYTIHQQFRRQIAPLAHPGKIQIIGFAKPSQRSVAAIADRQFHGAVKIQDRQKIRPFIPVLPVCFIGRPLFFQRPFPGIGD